MAGLTHTDTDPGDTQCLLHIPYKNVGAEIADLLKQAGVPNSTATVAVDRFVKHLEENYLAMERWAKHFYTNCICDCETVDGSS